MLLQKVCMPIEIATGDVMEIHGDLMEIKVPTVLLPEALPRKGYSTSVATTLSR